MTVAPAAQEDKLGLRWRTEAEVLSGKGQFSCGARGCAETRGLATFEVPFGYTEAGQRRDALVKVGARKNRWTASVKAKSGPDNRLWLGGRLQT